MLQEAANLVKYSAMDTVIDGIRITLTPDQEKTVMQAKAEREKSFKSFKSILIHFGFTKEKGLDGCYGIDKWWAEISENGDHVWLVGKGLKTSAFPGGWIYWTPNELALELQSASID